MKRCHFNPNTAMICIIPAVVTFNFIVTGGQLTISECQPSGRINISDDGNTQSTFTCNGFHANETVQWVLRRDGMQKFSVKCGQTCDYTDSNVNVSRPMGSSSTFTIARSFWEKQEYADVVCSSANNTSNLYTCHTNVTPTTTTQPHTQDHPVPTTVQTHPSSTPDPHVPTTVQTHPPSTPATSATTTVLSTPTKSPATSATTTVLSTPTKSPGSTTEGEENKDDGDHLPVEAIGGGVAALVVILIILIVVVVVVKRRQRKKAAGNNNDDLEEHVNPMYGSGDEPDTTSSSNSKPSGVALRISTDTSNSNNTATLDDADNAFDAGYYSVAFGEQQTASPSSATSPGGESSQNTTSQPGFPTNTKTPVVVTDADLYAAVDDMEQEHATIPEQDHSGGHSTEEGPNNSSTTGPSGDVYAVVQKSGPRAQSTSATTTQSPNGPGDSADGAYTFVDVSRSSAPVSSTTIATSGDPVSDNADNTYAVVNKSSSRGKGTGAATTPDTSDSSQQAPSGDVYAQVDKSSKGNASTRENDGEGQNNVYAQVDKTSKGNNSTPVQQTQAQEDKPKPGIKPKPALKPKPSSNI